MDYFEPSEESMFILDQYSEFIRNFDDRLVGMVASMAWLMK